MPYEVRVDPETAIVMLRAYGEGNPAEGAAAFDRAFALVADAERPRLFIDIRDLSYTPEADAARRFADLLAAGARPGQRTAFCCNPGLEFGVARMVATFAELRGTEVSAFMDREEAVRWLLE